MTTPRSDPDDLSGLISGLLDGTLPPGERARLDSRLSQDPAARRLYMQMVDQEIELACLLAPDRDRTPHVLAPVVEEKAGPSVSRRTGHAWRLTGIAAAVAAVIALTAVFWPRETLTPVRGETVAWNADFEDGAAPGWIGQITSAGLPAGSNFGIRPVDQTSGGTVVSQIQLPADWERGLFSLTSLSTLHITCRHTQKNGWFDVFMHTGGPNPDKPENSMFMLRQGRFPGDADQWRTISIPFSEFLRKVPDPSRNGELSFIGGSPREGERVLSLGFSGSPGFDIIIDRIWITEGGTDAAITQPLP